MNPLNPEIVMSPSRWDRYLGMTAVMTQVPLTFASDYRKCSKCLMLNIVIV